MYNLTKNDARVIDFLLRNFKERNSINGLGRKLNISPRGIYKILKKLEKINAIKPENIGNAIYYKANLDDEIGFKLAELVLAQSEFNSYAKVWAEDFKKLKNSALSCVLYGSVLKAGREARDVDIIIILEKRNYKKVYKLLEEIKEITPKKVHDIMMAKEDLAKNLRKNNPAMIEMIKTGKVLWGSEIIVEGIKNGTS